MCALSITSIFDVYCYFTAHDFALNEWRHTYFPSNSWRFDWTMSLCECEYECVYVQCAHVCVIIPMWNVQIVGFNVAAKSNHCNRSAVRLTEMSHSVFCFSTRTLHACVGNVFIYFWLDTFSWEHRACWTTIANL